MHRLANNLPATNFLITFVGVPLLNALKLNLLMFICSIIALHKFHMKINH